MDLPREKLLNNILVRAVEQPPEQRLPFLKEACQGDGELLSEARAYLGHEDEVGDFLEEPIIASLSPGTASGEDTTTTSSGSFRLASLLRDKLPERIGSFRILELLGQGGMGIVYRAEQTEPVRRQVALKLIHAGLSGSQAQARFAIERQALALLAHPNIGQMLEAGTTDDGFPYFVMELVVGEPINSYCDQHKLTLERRLELFQAVCRGVQHAHQNQILHRDLKPSNILVTEVDGQPVPKIIDFGVAKALAQPLTDISVATGKHLIGTPSFMSPEALQGSLDPSGGPNVDTRSDIYTLGVLLYELLAGARPLDVQGLSFYEIGRRIIDEPAPALSQRFTALDAATRSSIAEARGTDEVTFRQLLGGGLQSIVGKALARNPRDRYSSTAALEQDIDRWLSQARQAEPRSRANRRQAVREAETIRLLTGVLLDVFSAVGEGDDPRNLLDRGAAKIRAGFEDRPRLKARLMDSIAAAYDRLGLDPANN